MVQAQQDFPAHSRQAALRNGINIIQWDAVVFQASKQLYFVGQVSINKNFAWHVKRIPSWDQLDMLPIRLQTKCQVLFWDPSLDSSSVSSIA